MDETDWILLRALQQDARVSFAELGRRTGLSAPAVAERVRRMEDQQIVTGYHAAVDPAALGLDLEVWIRINVSNKDYPKFKDFVLDAAEIFECHHVTGQESFLLRARVADVAALEALIGRVSPYGQTATSVVLSTVLGRRIIEPPGRSKVQPGNRRPVR